LIEYTCLFDLLLDDMALWLVIVNYSSLVGL